MKGGIQYPQMLCIYVSKKEVDAAANAYDDGPINNLYQGISMNDSLYERFSERPRHRAQPREEIQKRMKISFAF